MRLDQRSLDSDLASKSVSNQENNKISSNQTSVANNDAFDSVCGFDSIENHRHNRSTTGSLNSSTSSERSTAFDSTTKLNDGQHFVNGQVRSSKNSILSSITKHNRCFNNFRFEQSSDYSSQNQSRFDTNHSQSASSIDQIEIIDDRFRERLDVNHISTKIERNEQCSHNTHNKYCSEDENEDEGALDTSTNQTDFVNEITTLEIVLPNEMLEKNVQIRIAPDLEQFDLIYQTTLHRTNPIIIYCFESLDQHLTEIDHQHLSELKRRLPSMPIFFTQITDFDISYGKFTHSLIDCFTKSHRCVSSPQSSCCKVKSSSESNPHNCKYQCLSACGQLIKSSQLDYDHSQIDCFKNYQNQIIDFEIDDQNEQSQKQKISKNYSKQLETKKVIKNLKFEENSSAQDLDHNHLMPRELNRSCCVRLEKEKNKSIKVEEQCENQTRSNSIQKQLNELSFFQKIYLQALRRDFSDQYKQTRENSCSQSRKDIDESFCPCDKQATVEDSSVDSHFIDRLHQFGKFITFFRMLIKSNLVVAATLLNEFQNRFTQEFIFSAFDMTWNLNYSIPKRLEYVKNKEAKLYMSLLGIANRKQDEIKQIIAETLQFIRDDILEQASNYNFTIHRLNHNNQDHRDNSSTIVSAAETKQCIMEIQDFVFMTLNRAIAIKLIGSIDVMHESFIGVSTLFTFLTSILD